MHLSKVDVSDSNHTRRTRWARVLVCLATCALVGIGAPAWVSAAVSPFELQLLTNLYNATGGPGWATSTNWLAGDLCDNGWARITCNAGGTAVTQVLYSNNLAGSIPALTGRS